MKRARKLLSLFLAIALVLSVFVLPASAAEPRATTCPQCKKTNTIGYEGVRYIQRSSYHVMDGSCPYDENNHPHFICDKYDVYGCSTAKCSYEYTVLVATNVDRCLFA